MATKPGSPVHRPISYADQTTASDLLRLAITRTTMAELAAPKPERKTVTVCVPGGPVRRFDRERDR